MSDDFHTCGECGQTFDNGKVYGAHVATHASEADEDELRDELRSFADEKGTPPTASEMDNQGAYSASTYRKHFGSWDEALTSADISTDDRYTCGKCGETFDDPSGLGGHKAKHSLAIKTEALKDELRRVADELGEPPTVVEMREYGNHDPEVYQRRFGSWNGAIQEIGLEPRGRQSIPRDELLENLTELTKKIGRCPTQDDINTHAEFSSAVFHKRFGSIQAAREAAGIEIDGDFNSKIPTSVLIEDLQRVALETEGAVFQHTIDEHGTYSSAAYTNRFGSIGKAREEADIEQPDSYHPPISDGDLIEELRRLGNELGHRPSRGEMNELGEYSGNVYRLRFGSWTAAVERAGFDIDPRPWRGSDVPFGPNWREQRELAIQRDGEECQECGLTRREHREEYGFDLTVHHETPRGAFDSSEEADRLENLVTLCAGCHGRIEWDQRKREAAN